MYIYIWLKVSSTWEKLKSAKIGLLPAYFNFSQMSLLWKTESWWAEHRVVYLSIFGRFGGQKRGEGRCQEEGESNTTRLHCQGLQSRKLPPFKYAFVQITSSKELLMVSGARSFQVHLWISDICGSTKHRAKVELNFTMR